jgi:translation initiation factor 2 subunit 1|eukprot:CAMPEP_0174289038 /NCGR_PEP_ID=MMETSP0809-20121228/23352_1 /TAXON_ID=73025 ORGANISM="Eutreptiella gymnastica-like, Strain CCMP1594" /NCGR_SAMPLE_ID=MMETSP0809 /ASSEMBLY_ACC=CAM_ASM_000658 /LENGTH=325 /DNA_ID=CAMNT_0015386713 /DNA_START=18 /DNA_END=995 /DNA_ORIENTATION=+
MAEPTGKVQRLGENEQVENCRFYEQRYPSLEGFVMVRVKSISASAAYVQLMEYNNIEGMIPLTELSRRRIRSVNKHIRVGKTEIVQVFRLDEDKGYIDLSKKKVTEDDLKPCETRYNKAKDVHSIMTHVAKECRCNLESLYQAVAWPLYRKYGHAYDAFGASFADSEKVLGPLGLEEDIKEKLIQTIQHRHKAQPFRVRADVEVTCFKYEGIDAIREALKAGERSVEGNECALTIRLLAAPTYVIVANSVDKDDGLALVEKAIESIKTEISAKGGQLKVTKAAAVVHMEDDMKHQTEDEEMEEDEEEEDEEDEEDDDEDDDKNDD